MAETVSITIPNIGDYSDVPVVEIMVKEGDSVQKDDSILSLESDKAVLDVPSPHAGTVKSITVKEGDTVSEGDEIGTIEISDGEESGGEKAEAKEKDKSEEKPSEKEKKKTQEKKSGSEPEERKAPPRDEKKDKAEGEAGGRIHASPSVRLIARELDVDLSRVQATGPKGRIRKEDIKRHLQGSADGASFSGGIQINVDDFKKYGEIEELEANRIKKISAPRLQQSWQHIPHVTHFDECDITELEDFRKSSNKRLEDEGIKLTLLAFSIKASVIALKKFPLFNSSFIQERKTFVLKKYYNIGFAADTPDGLMVPVIKNADKKGLSEIGAELIELSTKARESKISVDDLKGATFTISSLGSIGGTSFTPIINPPEVAILGLARASYRPVYNRKTSEFEPRYILPFSLSYDHRAIDGAEGARFCAYLAGLLGDVRNLIL
ncbi:MAG: 2-oxo acid dehydrogenase subunit E2 [Spirochaetota bacterium]